MAQCRKKGVGITPGWGEKKTLDMEYQKLSLFNKYKKCPPKRQLYLP